MTVEPRTPLDSPLAKAELIPLDSSEDIVLDLLGSFFVSRSAFNTLVRALLDEELVVRVEVASRFYWHLHTCLDLQLARNAHLGLAESELTERFFASAKRRTLEHLGGHPHGVEKACDEVVSSARKCSDRSATEIALFSISDESLLTTRFYALAGMVSAMRGALDL